MVELLAGHALAEGAPLGEALRWTRAPRAQAAAVEVEAGRLGAGLRLVRVPQEQVRLAAAWPEALRPAQKWLTRVPSRLILQIPLLQTMAYLLLVLTLQAGVVWLLEFRMLPGWMAIDRSRTFSSFGWLEPVRLALTCAVPLLMASMVLVAWVPERLLSWGKHLRRAREAALAAGLVEAGAPPEARREVFASFGGPVPEHATLAELELVLTCAVASAEASHQRIVTTVRAIGFGLLIAVAAAMTAGVYQFVAQMALL